MTALGASPPLQRHIANDRFPPIAAAESGRAVWWRRVLPKSDQRQRFIETAREAGASEDEAVFDENLKRIVKGKPQQESKEK